MVIGSSGNSTINKNNNAAISSFPVSSIQSPSSSSAAAAAAAAAAAESITSMKTTQQNEDSLSATSRNSNNKQQEGQVPMSTIIGSVLNDNDKYKDKDNNNNRTNNTNYTPKSCSVRRRNALQVQLDSVNSVSTTTITTTIANDNICHINKLNLPLLEEDIDGSHDNGDDFIINNDDDNDDDDNDDCDDSNFMECQKLLVFPNKTTRHATTIRSSKCLTNTTSDTLSLSSPQSLPPPPPSPPTASTSTSTHHKSSMIVSIFTLVNNVAGAGILTLPHGQAYGNGTGYIPACMIAIVLGFLSAITFIQIGWACDMLKEQTFKGLWCRTIGPKSFYILDAIIFFMCLACAIIYCGILGDVLTTTTPATATTTATTNSTSIDSSSNVLPLLSSTLYNDTYNFRRSMNIIVVSFVVLLPLSSIRTLSGLSYTSFVGFASVLYTTLFVLWRSLDGTYQVGSGHFVTTITTANDGGGGRSNEGIETFPTITTTATNMILVSQPKFDHVSVWNFNFRSLLLMSNYGLAYVAHYNAPIYYRELDCSTGSTTNINNPQTAFSYMVLLSFSILIILYIITMIAGYNTFGDVCQGNILLNYHPNDILAKIGNIATGLSMLFGFPLIMAGIRESLHNILTSSVWCKAATKTATTTTLNNNERDQFVVLLFTLLFIVWVAVSIKDVSIIVGLNGAVMGSCITYIIPSIIYTKTIELVYGKNTIQYYYSIILSTCLLIPLGLTIAILGVYMTITTI